MDTKTKELLQQSLERFGEEERICSLSDLRRNWEKNTYSDIAYPKNTEDLFIRDALVGQGRILDEDLDNHTYVDLIRVGKLDMAEALLVTRVEGKAVYIAAYAKEGLIKQHLAEKAVRKVKTLLGG